MDVLLLIWAASINVILHMACTTPSNGDVIAWFNRAHFQIVRPEHVPLPKTNTADGPSNAAWGQMAATMSGVKQEFAEQRENKKAERNKKKDEWEKVLKNNRYMLFNVAS